MKSLTTLRNLYGSLTNNTDANNLTLGDQLINDAIRRICASFDWAFLEKTKTLSTTASTQFINLPFDYDRLVSVTVAQGSTVYTPRQCPSREMWDRLNMNSTQTSDVPQYYFIFNGQIGFYPTPSTTRSDVVTVCYRQRVIDLSMADYTTGTVTVTSGATTVTGSGTSWAAPMAGRWIKITPTNTAGSSGDGLWYQISSVASTTSLTLTRAYNGTTVSGGTAYTMGEMSVLPEAHQDLPVYWAAFVYFSSVQPEKQQSPLFKGMYDEAYARLQRDYGMKTSSPIMDYGVPDNVYNPNFFPQNIS